MKTNEQRVKALGNTKAIKDPILQKAVSDFSPWTPLPVPVPGDW